VSATARVRLAQELHDGIAQDLVGLSYFIDALLARDDASNELRQELRTLRFTISDVIERVRREIYELRVDTSKDELLFAGDKKYELSRVFNELIRNIDEHSQANEITISIGDDGIGGAQLKDGHHGLRGATERISDLGGCLSIESQRPGTHIEISLPWNRQ